MVQLVLTALLEEQILLLWWTKKYVEGDCDKREISENGAAK